MGFLASINVVCFATSYGIAWLLEVCRLFFRSPVRRAIMLGFAGLGLLLHTVFLAMRASQAAHSPLSSSFDWYLVAAWLLMGLFFYGSHYYPRAALGLFLFPLVLGLVVTAGLFADRQPFAAEPASKVWGMVHGLFLLLGTVAVMVGFVAGVMYLLEATLLKRHRLVPAGFKFPSLETLERLNARMVLVSALLVGVGFVAGIILKYIGKNASGPLPWSDPVVFTSAIMLGWLLAAALFNVVYVPARQGRKVAYLTVASFVFLAVSLGVLVLVDTQHGGKKKLPDAGTAKVTSCFDQAPACPSRASQLAARRSA